jgi:hypothetical protein
MVYCGLTAGQPTPATNTISSGQSSQLTINSICGAPPVSVEWYTISGSGGVSCTTFNAITGATANSYIASPTATNSYAYLVVDSATTKESICSPYSVIYVSSPSGIEPSEDTTGILAGLVVAGVFLVITRRPTKKLKPKS